MTALWSDPDRDGSSSRTMIGNTAYVKHRQYIFALCLLSMVSKKNNNNKEATNTYQALDKIIQFSKIFKIFTLYDINKSNNKKYNI